MEETPRLRRSDQISLAAVLTAVGCSRLFVRHVLERWRILQDHIETAELLTSELVTNAVQATGILESHPLYGDIYADVKLIGIRLLLFEHSIVIEVWDTSPKPPKLRSQIPNAEGGRGLFLVESISTRWSYYYPRNEGKVVWCELSLASAEADEAWKRDPHTLRRVLEGLQALEWDEKES